jgi:hypothetical protein
MFGLTLLVLLVASVNYQLNLGYVLTFLLAGSGVVSMHLTHATLRGLTLHLKPVAPVFAQSPAVLDVVITGPAKARFGIGLKILSSADSTLAWTNVPAGGQATVQVGFVPGLRGLHDVPALSARPFRSACSGPGRCGGLRHDSWYPGQREAATAGSTAVSGKPSQSHSDNPARSRGARLSARRPLR